MYQPELEKNKEWEQDNFGKWWFWEETWTDPHGPFDTEEECLEAFNEYCKYALGDQPY